MKFLLLLIGLFLASAGGAAAQSCNFSVSTLNFGTVNLLSGSSVDGTATIDISCTNILSISLAARLCLNLDAGTGGMGGGLRTMTSGANTLQYQLYRDAARTIPWGHSDTPALGTPHPLDILLLPLTTVTTSKTIYARIIGSQPATPGGSYVSTFSGANIRFNMATYSITPPNCSAVLQNASSPLFTVQAYVDRVCNLTADDLNFGSRGLLKTQVDASSLVKVSCTLGLPYAIGLNGGLGNLAPAARKMTHSGQSITYGLYRDAARSLPWGSAVGQIAGGTGTGLLQNLTVYGRVPAQTTPSPGIYTDTVVVTVTY